MKMSYLNPVEVAFSFGKTSTAVSKNFFSIWLLIGRLLYPFLALVIILDVAFDVVGLIVLSLYESASLH